MANDAPGIKMAFFRPWRSDSGGRAAQELAAQGGSFTFFNEMS
jgi:hypothetical protein